MAVNLKSEIARDMRSFPLRSFPHIFYLLSPIERAIVEDPPASSEIDGLHLLSEMNM